MEQFKKYSIVVDKNMDIITVGDPFLTYIGLKELHSMDQIVPPQDMIQLKNAVFAIDPGALNLSCFRIRTANGRLNWIAANITKTEGREGVINMELSDIQTLKAESPTIRIDEMTGLLNKQTITDYAIALTNMYPRKHFYFCLMDIDHFKSVNDNFGHMRGDEVIIDVAHIIKECVGDYGMVGRIGGDEFMIVLENVSEKPKCREVLSSIRETVENKYMEMEAGMNITVSIGTAFYPDYADDYDMLFKLTDKMLYLAKTKGRNRYIIYTPEIHGDVNAELKVATATHKKAAEKDKLTLMLRLMSQFLHETEIPIRTAIEEVLVAYDLDELFIFYGELEKCRYGIKRVDLEDESYRIEDTQNNMPFLAEPEFEQLFDENNTAIVNIFDLNRDKHAHLIEYMEKNERRFMVVYHMIQARKTGYLVYINTRENSRRLSESDINDLIYFARMVELTSSDR